MRRAAAGIVLMLVGAACSGTVEQRDSPPGTPVTTGLVTTSPTPDESVTTSPVATSPPATSPATTTPIGATDCPEVLAAELTQTAPGVFRVSATVRSVDIADVSYADAWEVRDLAGTVLGTRVLTHPHANEQPFTRSLSDVPIPVDVTQVEVDAKDSVRGFCGVSLIVEVPHS
jgi:hypothetical protein